MVLAMTGDPQEDAASYPSVFVSYFENKYN